MNRYNIGMLKQTTIKQLVKTVGVGLHSGTKVELVLRPAPVDTGIILPELISSLHWFFLLTP